MPRKPSISKLAKIWWIMGVICHRGDDSRTEEKVKYMQSWLEINPSNS
jgi:hypothetical protein